MIDQFVCGGVHILVLNDIVNEIIDIPDVRREVHDDAADAVDQLRDDHREQGVQKKEQEDHGQERADDPDIAGALVLRGASGFLQQFKDPVLDRLDDGIQDICDDKTVNDRIDDIQNLGDPVSDRCGLEQQKIEQQAACDDKKGRHSQLFVFLVRFPVIQHNNCSF